MRGREPEVFIEMKQLHQLPIDIRRFRKLIEKFELRCSGGGNGSCTATLADGIANRCGSLRSGFPGKRVEPQRAGMITTFLLICQPEPRRLRRSVSDRGTSRVLRWLHKLTWVIHESRWVSPACARDDRGVGVACSSITPVQTSSE